MVRVWINAIPGVDMNTFFRQESTHRIISGKRVGPGDVYVCPQFLEQERHVPCLGFKVETDSHSFILEGLFSRKGPFYVIQDRHMFFNPLNFLSSLGSKGYLSYLVHSFR